MVLEVTLILNSKIKMDTKFQVSIFKNDEVRGGGRNFEKQITSEIPK
jgi:hypothetical protein